MACEMEGSEESARKRCRNKITKRGRKKRKRYKKIQRERRKERTVDGM